MATQNPNPILLMVEALQHVTRQPRKGCQYNAEELKVLGKYKDEYKSKTTHQEREGLLRSKIFVDIFNHWDSQNISLSGPEINQRAKALCRWVTNNWRPYKTVHAAPPTRKKSYLDIVWRERKMEVLDELKVIVNAAELTEDQKFTKRTMAAKAVYQRLTVDEKASIKRKADEVERSVNPPAIQQKRATKLAAGKVAKWAEEQWNDLGMFSMTFYAYIDKDRKLVVAINDNMAAHAKIHQKRFVDLHSELVHDIQVKLIDYVKLLQHGSTGVPSTQPPKAVEHLKHYLATEDGYPIVPRLPDKDNVKKDELEEIIWRYLSAQYRLASGQKKKHVPFSILMDNTNEFIEAKYLPRSMTLRDPHNMTKAQLLDLMAHVQDREDKHGVNEAFRFRRYHNGMEMAPAEYGRHADEERAAVRSEKARAAHGKRSKSIKGKEKMTQRPDRAAVIERNAAAANNLALHIDPLLQSGVPALPNSPSEEFPPEPSIRRITTVEMEVLMSLGHPPVAPINGPNDGLPEYEVPVTAFRLLQGRQTTHDQPQEDAVRQIHKHPKPQRKRAMNADAYAQKEAEELMQRSKRSRSRRGGRR